ncbi:helix-turn-helix transcriptional regulator [Bradyrhizobium sp. BRP22]|uniref:helix-turn-helix domain-containing protein n=1 Tax=Bradyrhizobium sp. BRP22 TaxID=2793821 RepID=UPI001CD7C8B4|nr:helix-turn-helix transcriptional regulator [Bradyrhizobium sp. BRP22]MCA1458975.1 helix-turn-helix transcriptional regulator [Bradyrhizobium sp. BRP22]
MSKSTDGHIDQLVQAKWREIGLSQSDLAEVLGATPPQRTGRVNGRDAVDIERLRQVASALGVSVDLFNGRASSSAAARARRLPEPGSASLQSLLELRLLRLFRELHDVDTKRILIDLAAQMVKRQAGPSDEAG